MEDSADMQAPRCAKSGPTGGETPVADFGRMYMDDRQQTWGYGPEVAPGPNAASEPFRAGRYVILQHVGHGAMGNVYAAYDPDLDRKVAVKVLRDSTRGRPLPATLVREAKAMAKLTHPHVVTVFDVGHCERGVFVAMEYVEGQTLRTWLKQQERSWREVLAAFVQAGQGLAAAHAAGVIHHDFKPDNVLVSAGGVVKVADFGLARVAAGTAAAVSGELGDPSVTRSSQAAGLASGSATPTHASERGPVGTLAYMAPERHLQCPADARSDQFSFCVALHEALYRERPFSGTNVDALRYAVLNGEPAEPPRGSPVPPRVAAVLRRGLARAPEDRFGDMDALVAALAEPAPRRRHWTLSAGLLLGAAGAMMAATRAEDRCAAVGVDEDLGWQAGVATLRGRFSDAALGEALDGLAGLEQRWLERKRGNCSAGEQLASDLRLARDACLDQRMAQMQAVLTQAGTAASAEDAAYQLAQVARHDDCDDPAALTEVTPPTPAQAAAVRAGRETLAAIAALEVAGAYSEALAELAPLQDEVLALGYPPLVAEVTYQRARLEHYRGASSQARESLGQAIDLAEAHRHDRLAADAWGFWVEIAALSPGLSQASIDAALRRATAAQTRLQRPGQRDLSLVLGEPVAPASAEGDPQRVHPLLMQGLVHLSRKERALADEAFRAALAEPGLHPLTRAKLLHNRAVTVQALKGVSEAEATRAWDEAVAAFRSATWAEHPSYARARIRRGEFLQWKTHFAAARLDFLAGAAILAGDPDSHATDLRTAHTGVALADLMAFHIADAAAEIHSAMIAGHGLPADMLLAQIGFEANLLAGQTAKARDAATREVELHREAVVADHEPGNVFALGHVEGHLAEAFAVLGDDDAARTWLSTALQHLEEGGMGEAEPGAYPRRTLGLLELRAGHEAAAEAAFTQALALWQAEPCGCRDAAEAQLGLAALYRRRGDARAEGLQRAADQYFTALGAEALAYRDRVLATFAR